MDQSQKEQFLKMKNNVDKIKSKLTLINVILFGLCLLFMIIGGSAINLSTKYDSMDIGFWKISELAKEAKETRSLEQLASTLSTLSFFTIVLLIVLAAGIALNLIWRTWDDKKHNAIKNIVAAVFFLVVLIMFFMIISMNNTTSAAVLPGWAFWIMLVCAFVVGTLHLTVFAIDKQLAKVDINE